MSKGEDYVVKRVNSDRDGGAAGRENSVDGPQNRVKEGESGGSYAGPGRHTESDLGNDAQAGHKGSAPQADNVKQGLTEADYIADMEASSAMNTSLLRESLGYRHANSGDGLTPDPDVKTNGQDNPKGNYRN